MSRGDAKACETIWVAAVIAVDKVMTKLTRTDTSNFDSFVADLSSAFQPPMDTPRIHSANQLGGMKKASTHEASSRTAPLTTLGKAKNGRNPQ